MQQLILTVFFVFAVMAVIDLFWQRRRLSKQLMMQKHEVKREHKENEGYPETKNFRRNLFREIVTGDMGMIPRASAVVANPTHLAVVLYYQPPATGLPVIVVKGSGVGATAIFKAARQAGVPIIQNIGVARRLFKQPVYTSIPSDMINAVAEIIVMARQIRKAAGYDEPETAEEVEEAAATATPDPKPGPANMAGNATPSP